MKKWIGVLTMFTIVFWGEGGLPIDFNVSSGIHFDWWQDTKDNKGRQSYVPLSLEAHYKDFSISLLTGYAYTYKDPYTGPSHSFSHALDSKLKLSYEIIEKLPVDILIGLDFNLPTGKTDLKLKEINLLMDPYLVSISQFGEGFNINPTFSLAKDWGKWVFGIGGGYLGRGKYDYGTVWESPSSIIKINDYSPGDIFSLTGEIRYEFSPNFSSRLFGNYFWYEKTTWKELYKNGGYQLHKRSLKEGELWLLGMGINYNQNKLDFNLTFKGILRGKNKYDYTEEWYYAPGFGWFAYLNDSPVLANERKNSHGDEWVGDLSAKYFLDEKTTLKSYFQVLFITKNDYPSFSLHYQGRREKYSLGFGLRRILIPHLEVEVYCKGFLMHDGERRYPLNYFFPDRTLSERHYKGFSGGVMLTGRF